MNNSVNFIRLSTLLSLCYIPLHESPLSQTSELFITHNQYLNHISSGLMNLLSTHARSCRYELSSRVEPN